MSGIVVNTNTMSLKGQNNLNKSTSKLNTSLERLSSGSRINTAADDAAGLSIATGLTSQVNGLDQANRNVSDGLSMLGTAEGAIDEQTNILQRMRELAVKSANDTNSSKERKAINDEATKLSAELDRIARTTSFNGNNLLDGSYTNKNLQVGANSTANDKIAVNLDSSQAADLGSCYKAGGTGVVTGAALTTAATLTINSVNIGATTDDGVSTSGGTGSALAIANAINNKTYQTGVSAKAETTVTAGGAQTGAATGQIDINGVTITSGVTLSGAGDTTLVNLVNANSAETGVTAELDSATSTLKLTAADGRNIDVTVTGGAGSGLVTGVTEGTVTLSSAKSFDVGTVGTGTTIANVSAGSATVDSANNLSTIDLTTADGATSAIDVIDTAISQLSDQLSAIGAMTNRLTTTQANLSTASENASSSKSTIMDADFASETASMSQQQILQQAGVSVLAQANSTPQLALSLLQG